MAALEEPSKPQNAYWIWLSANRDALTKEAGTGKGSVVGKLAGERWKALPAAQKKPFEEQAAVKKAAYEKAMAEFQDAGGQKGKRSAAKKEEKEGKANKKARKEANKALVAAGKPKKAPSAYWLFLSEHRAAITKEAGSGSAPVVAKLTSKKWAELPEAKKKPYEAKAAELKAEYDKAIKEWKEKNAAGGIDEEEDAGEEDA